MAYMHKRLLESLVRNRLSSSPAVALLGPRQSGKTTLTGHLGGLYFDLENPADQTRCDLEWGAITASKTLVILDEAQSWPGLFPRLRSAIDADRRRNGRFLLLGSVSPALMKNVSESLAGRLALCELTPFLAVEFPKSRWDDLWLMGGYPNGGILGGRRFPDWQRDYLTLLARRDLPLWGLPAKAFTTERLFKMLASCHGQVLNASDIGRGLGLSYHTISHYLDFLVNSYLIHLLPTFGGPLSKRVIRHPKLYWRDSGLLHALMGATSREELMTAPWLGFSWEGWVVEQIIGHLQAHGVWFEASYLRTKEGLELDLIIQFSRARWAFEIKLTTAPSPQDIHRLNTAADLIQANRRVLVSRAPQTADDGKTMVTNLAHLIDLLPHSPEP